MYSGRKSISIQIMLILSRDIFSSIVDLVTYHISNRWTDDNTPKTEESGRCNVEGQEASDLRA